MAKLIRVDAELVRRHLAKSRKEAAELIGAGRVYLDKMEVTKPARQMDPAAALIVKETGQPRYASRGAYKLIGALDYLGEDGPTVAGVRALDAGASTGGFTDVLLQRGAASVGAVDVGYGQIAWKLREDPRVDVIERTNVRTLDPAIVAPAPSLVVGDLSFISLTLVIPALVAVSSDDAEFVLMVKPQFEIGKERLGHGGVVRNLAHHHETVKKVALGLLVNAGFSCALWRRRLYQVRREMWSISSTWRNRARTFSGSILMRQSRSLFRLVRLGEYTRRRTNEEDRATNARMAPRRAGTCTLGEGAPREGRDHRC